MIKICSKCRTPYPATREHFTTASQAAGSKDGLHSWCKECLRKRGREQIPHMNEQRRGRTVLDPFRIRGQRLRNGMISRANERGLPFDRDYYTSERMTEMLRSTPTCPCCGVELLTTYSGLAKPLDNSPSIERVTPSLGYVQGNVALLCFRCNTIKRDASLAELERIVVWLRGRLKAG